MFKINKKKILYTIKKAKLTTVSLLPRSPKPAPNIGTTYHIPSISIRAQAYQLQHVFVGSTSVDEMGQTWELIIRRSPPNHTYIHHLASSWYVLRDIKRFEYLFISMRLPPVQFASSHGSSIRVYGLEDTDIQQRQTRSCQTTLRGTSFNSK